MTIHTWLADEAGWMWPRVANHLWQATLFFLVAWIVASLLKPAPARLRYSVWLLSLARFVVPSLLFAWLGLQAEIDLSWPSPRTPKVSPYRVVQLSSMTSRVVTPISLERDVPIAGFKLDAGHREFYCLATTAWLIGCLLLVCRQIRRGLASRRVVKAGTVVDAGREMEILNRVRAALSVSRRVKLVLSSAIDTPAVWGLGRPVVILPKQLAADLGDDELETLMMHEVFHVKHWDNLVGLFQAGVGCLLWFYPVVWFLNERLLREREKACDEAVLLRTMPRTYLSSILKVVRFCLDSRLAGVSSATGSNLRRRIENIMSDPKEKKLTSWHVLSLSLLLLALVLSAIVAASPRSRVTMAQSRITTPSLSGTVYDASRAAIPGAMVVISSLDGKTREVVVADDAGEYKFGLLPEGSYAIEVSKLGFRWHRQSDVAIKSGQQQRLDLMLEVGEVSQYVEVVGRSPRTPPAQTKQPRRIRVGGNVQQANLIHEVRPDYPEAARQAGIEGTISLEAIIGKDGTVVNHRVLNTLADPSLAKAASQAVKQWLYQPTLLNGEPIEVVTTITINFRLSDQP
jgi:TonB family protein